MRSDIVKPRYCAHGSLHRMMSQLLTQVTFVELVKAIAQSIRSLTLWQPLRRSYGQLLPPALAVGDYLLALALIGQRF